MIFSQISRAARLDRSFYTSLVYDQSVVGNAVVVAALMAVAIKARWNVVVIAYTALGGLLAAGLAAAGLWAVGVYAYRRSGLFSTSFRIAGFASVTFLPAAIVSLAGSVVPGVVLVLAWTTSIVWFMAALRMGAMAQFDVDGQQALLMALAGFAGWYFAWLFI